MKFLFSESITQTPDTHIWKLSRGTVAVLLLGFLTRVYLFVSNPVINPDGFLYIQQAKALYFGLFDQVLACYHYLSPYPIFIAFTYPVIGDWVISAQWINILFGSAAIVPLYWILRRFFDDMTAWVTAMVFALIPSFVVTSRDVLRDPSFWFFAVSGLYFFILYMEKRQSVWLFLSSIFFLSGAWARIEGTLFIIVSFVFLVFLKKERPWKELAAFLCPYAIIAASSIIFAHVRQIDLMEFINPSRLLTLPLGFFAHYNILRDQLQMMYDTELGSLFPYFFPQVRNLLWFIAFGTLLVQLAETLLYFFFVLLFIGMVYRAGQLKTDLRMFYLWVLSLMSLVLLYIQIIYFWHMPSRFLGVFLLPSFIFIGEGIDQFVRRVSSRFKLRADIAYAIMCMIILAFFMPKNIRANFSEDRLLFNQIGNYIVERENNSRPVSVCGVFKYVRAIHFFANVNFAGAPCFESTSILNHADEKGLKKILTQKFDYLVWDEKGWNNTPIETISTDMSRHFSRLQQWHSERWGNIVLYEVKP